MNDEELERHLKQWQPEMPEEPGFRRNVWAKIERDASNSADFPSIATRFFDWINRPNVGIPMAAAVLAIVGVFALMNGRASHDEVMLQMATSYHNTINPLNHHVR